MSKNKFADLHLHTYYSDGTFSPLELMQQAKEKGISCISITDHDTVEALPLAFLNKLDDFEIIAGIELSCDWHEKEAHILGYFIDYQSKNLLARLEKIRVQRIERIHLMVDKLKSMDVDIEVKDVFKLSKVGTVGRLHLARALLEKGVISNIPEAFIKFIADGGPAYVGRFKMSAEEAVELIISCGGIAVLAHPYTIADDDFIETLVGYGLKGLEVYYSQHSKRHTQHYKILAERFGLVETGGSDCHGNAKENIKLGSVCINYDVVDRLRQAKQGL